MSAIAQIPRGWIPAAGAVGAAGLAATGVGVALSPHRALISYVFGFTCWFTVAMGALLALLAFHATGARWIAPFRRLVELLALGVVLATAFALPLLIATPALYPWARAGFGPTQPDAVWTLRGLYLRRDFFTARTVFYLVVWSTVAPTLLRASLRTDADASANRPRAMRILGAASMPLVLFTATFAVFDWLMSLTPEWSSEIYGLYVLTGGFVAAFALLCIVGAEAHRRALLPTVTEWHFHSLGKLLFAVVCFWAYIAYDQYMLIWIANEPREIPWYALRTQGGAKALFLALIFAHFVVPFLVLLPRVSKVRLPVLEGVCGLLLAAHVLDVYWIVVPTSGERAPRWTDLAAFAGVGGVFVAFTLWRFSRTALVARGDPELRVATGLLASPDAPSERG